MHGGGEVYWHERLGTWGLFHDTDGKHGETRPWNAFGHIPSTFGQNIVVEINQPRFGIDTDLQSVFATDSAGKTWVLHQGRMSVPGVRITEADFVAVTGFKPAMVRFSNGERHPYHAVACLDVPARDVQSAVAEFVRNCAMVRLNAKVPPKLAKTLTEVRAREDSLTPEKTGSYETAPRRSVTARRNHATIWKALAAQLKRRKIGHANTRVFRFGPDLFTTHAPLVLFEIKTRVEPRDVFEAIGQLDIYEQLLETKVRKVLVVPQGIGKEMIKPLTALEILRIDYTRSGNRVSFDQKQLEACLAAKAAL
jgi:hypothetical protein